MSQKLDRIIKITILVVLGVWIVTGFAIISSKVLSNDYTFAATDHSGDGISTISDIAKLQSQPFLQNDGSQFYAPLMYFKPAMDDTWWIVRQFFSFFFTPNNVYDFLAILYWVLNLLAGYYLIRILKLSRFSACLFALVIAGLEVFPNRITGHLTLSAIFIPLLQIAFAYKLIENPSNRNILLFSILSIACFISNEYYGYFGFIFSITLLFFYYLQNFKRVKEFNIKGVILGIMIFCSGMGIVYANLFRNLFFSIGGSKDALVHNYFEHIAWSVKNPLETFYNSKYNLNIPLANPPEFSFHVGFFILLFIVAFLLYAIIRKITLDKKLILSTFFSGLVLGLFGQNPDSLLSLEKITYHFAPQFRVGARAYLWVSFALLLMAAVIYRDVIKYQKAHPSDRFAFLLPLSSLALVALLLDATMGFYIHGPRIYPLPRNTAYKYIANYPQGWLLELPFYGPSDPPEYSYRYSYNRIDHKKMIVNFPTSSLGNFDPILANELNQFKQYLNNPDPELVHLLQEAGIKYIAVSDPQIKSKFDRMGYVPVVDAEGVAIYEFNSENQIDLKSLAVCNTYAFNYDLKNDQELPHDVGIWSTTGITSNGSQGFLLMGPALPVTNGTYTLRMEGVLTSGSATLDLTSAQGSITLESYSINESMVDQNGHFEIEKLVHFDHYVNDLEIRVWVDAQTTIEIQNYTLREEDPVVDCQGLELDEDPLSSAP